MAVLWCNRNAPKSHCKLMKIKQRKVSNDQELVQSEPKPNTNIKMSSFKSSENIQKKKGGSDRSISENQSSSVKTCIFHTRNTKVQISFATAQTDLRL